MHALPSASHAASSIAVPHHACPFSYAVAIQSIAPSPFNTDRTHEGLRTHFALFVPYRQSPLCSQVVGSWTPHPSFPLLVIIPAATAARSPTQFR